MKLREDEVAVPGPDGTIRAIVIGPVDDLPRPGVLLYTDIFQLTESTLRTARRLASWGSSCVFRRSTPTANWPGSRWSSTTPASRPGSRAPPGPRRRSSTPTGPRCSTSSPSAPTSTTLLAVGFCIGGHLAFRAAFDPRVAATVCFYPTGLQDGKLGAERPGSLARAADISGRLMVVFGSRDPHVPDDARVQILSALYAAGLTDLELHVYAGGEHAFMRDVGARHDPVLTDLALDAAVSFLGGR